jgi:hypothetical protein
MRPFYRQNEGTAETYAPRVIDDPILISASDSIHPVTGYAHGFTAVGGGRAVSDQQAQEAQQKATAQTSGGGGGFAILDTSARVEDNTVLPPAQPASAAAGEVGILDISTGQEMENCNCWMWAVGGLAIGWAIWGRK